MGPELRCAAGHRCGGGRADNEERGDSQEQARRVERDAPVEAQLREAWQLPRSEAPEQVLPEPGETEPERRPGPGEDRRFRRQVHERAPPGRPERPAHRELRPARSHPGEEQAREVGGGDEEQEQSGGPEQEQSGPVRAHPLLLERPDPRGRELGVLLRVARREVGSDVRELPLRLATVSPRARGGRYPRKFEPRSLRRGPPGAQRREQLGGEVGQRERLGQHAHHRGRLPSSVTVAPSTEPTAEPLHPEPVPEQDDGGRPDRRPPARACGPAPATRRGAPSSPEAGSRRATGGRRR